MDVNEPIMINLRVKGVVTPEPAQFRSGNRPLYDEARQRDVNYTPAKLYDFQPIRHLTEEALQDLEATELGPGPIPLDLDYTVSRSPSGLSAVTNRVFFAIVVYLTNTDMSTTTTTTTTTPTVEEPSKAAKLLRWLISLLKVSKIMLAEAALKIIVAGLHAQAWNFDFPTRVERLLWRLSCIGIAVTPMLLVPCVGMNSYHNALAKALWHWSMVGCNAAEYFPQALVVLYEIAEVNAKPSTTTTTTTTTTVEELETASTASATLEEGSGESRDDWKDIPRLKIFLHVCLLVLCVLLLACFLISILFITVEGYISLRSLPDSAFMTPNWADYWPHL